MMDDRLHVIVVDDDIVLRSNIKKFLEDRYNYLVDAVEDGVYAIELINNSMGNYDVAVIDQLLKKGPNGIQVMQDIRLIYPEIECIIITGWGSTERQDALLAGAFRYIEKRNFDFDELALLIRTAAQQVRLRAISRAILSRKGTQSIFDEINSAARALINADEAAIVLVNQETVKQKRYTAPLGTLKHWQKHFKDSNLTEQLISSGKPISIPRITEDSRVDETFAHSGYNSFAALPIPGESINLGVFFIYSKQPGHFEAFGILPLLQILASQVGLALANSNAFHEIELHAHYMGALVKAAESLTRTFELKSRLEIAWEFVHEQLQVSTFYIGLFDQRTHMLTFPLAYDEGKSIEIPNRVVDNQIESQSISSYVVLQGEELSWNSSYEKKFVCEAHNLDPISIGRACESCFYLPLRILDDVIGLVSIQSYDKQAFSEILLDAFRALGSEIAVAIESSHRFDLLHQATQNLSSLNSVVLEIGKENNRNRLLDKIILQATRLLRVEGGGIYLVDPRSDLIYLAASIGLPQGADTITLHRDDGLNGIILNTGQVQFNNDYGHWEKRIRAYDEYHINVAAGAPIKAKNVVVGTLIVHDTRKDQIFSDTMLGLLQQFANHAALVLQKVELLEKLQRIEEVASAINSSHDLKEIFTLTCQSAVEIFGADHSGIVLFDLDKQQGNVVGEYPSKPATFGLKIPLHNISMEDHLIYEQKPIVYENILEHSEELGPVFNIWQKLDIRSVMIVPMTYKGSSIGSFSLDAVGRHKYFANEDIELCTVFANAVTVAITNTHLFEELQRREQLLSALEEAIRNIRGEREIPKLLHEVVGQAVDLVSGDAGCLLVHLPHLNEFEVRVVYDMNTNLVGSFIEWDHGWISSSASEQTSCYMPDMSTGTTEDPVLKGFLSAAIIPIKHIGTIDALLLVASKQANAFQKADIDILDRFAIQAGAALHTAQLMSREQRAQGQLNTLHQITEYIQRSNDQEKILHVVLTGVTAGYGLGFNRAAFFLWNAKSRILVGQLGIGYLEKQEALTDWSNHHASGRENFKRYIELLENGKIDLTIVGQNIRKLNIQIPEFSSSPLQDVVQKNTHLLLSAERLTQLPDELLDALAPETELAIIPVLASESLIGILLADNKFTRSPITKEDLESLMTFSASAANAIEKARLFQEAELGRKRLHSLFEASNALTFSQGIDIALQDIVEQACLGADATGVSLILIRDELAHNVISAGVDNPAFVQDVRCNEISMSVLKTSQPKTIDNTENIRNAVNWTLFDRQVGAAICMPVESNTRKYGVMWFHYSQPRTFVQSEIEAIRLYVNHTALVYDSAQLFEQVSKARNATREVTRLAVLGNLHETLSSVLLTSQGVLDFDAATIYSYDRDHDKFIFPPEMIGVLHEERVTELNGVERTSIVYEILDKKETLIIRDAKNDYRFKNRRFTVEEDIHTLVGLPLQVGEKGEIVGVMFVNYRRAYPLTDETINEIRLFANLAAVAIYNAQLYEIEQNQRDALMAIQDTSAMVSAMLEIDTLLPTIAFQGADIFKAPATSIMLWDENKENLVIRASYGLTEAYKNEQRISYDTVQHIRNEQGDGPHILNISNKPLGSKELIKSEKLKHSLVTPLHIGDELIGVLNIYSKEEHAPFSDRDKELAEILANHTAIAIENARNHEAEKRRVAEMSALNKVSQSIRHLTDLDLLYKQITASVADLVQAKMCAILLHDSQLSRLVCQLPMHGVRDIIGKNYQIPLDIEPVKELWETRNNLILNDIINNPLLDSMGLRDLAEDVGLHHTAFVKIASGINQIGVLQVSNKSNDAPFNLDDVHMLSNIAGQVGVVIENARLYDVLNRTRNQLAARTSLVWTNMLSSVWRHTIVKHALTIREQVGLLRMQNDLDVNKLKKITERLSMIERLATQILEKPITPPLTSEEGVVSIYLEELIQDRVNQLHLKDGHRLIVIRLNLPQKDRHTVRIDPDWFRRALDIVLENAALVLQNKPDGEINVTTSYTNESLIIQVKDNGPGFPPDEAALAFSEIIPKQPGEPGMGIGLLMARIIVEAFKGEIKLQSTSPEGSEILITLPLERK